MRISSYKKQIALVLLLSLFSIETATAGSCIRGSSAVLERKAAKYQENINLAAKKYQIDRELIQAVIAVESCFKSRAVSVAGAQGLMQLMPATADRFGVSDSFNPRQNIFAGSRYLKWLLKRFNGNLKYALAGYNAGEGRVDQYNGIPPFKETQSYVKKVLAVYRTLAPAKLQAKTKTIANGSVYFPYAPLKSVKKPTKTLYKTNFIRPKPIPKPQALTAKPGRQGLDFMKSRAPHLYRKP